MEFKETRTILIMTHCKCQQCATHDPFRDLYVYAVRRLGFTYAIPEDSSTSLNDLPDSWFYPEDVDDVYVDYNFDC
jgi:hypothetical protein